MHKNRSWIALVIFVAAMTLWFGGKALVSLYNYYSLTNRIELSVKRFEIRGNGSDAYRLIAHFTTPQGGEGEGVVGSVYRNPWSAERAKEKFENKPLEAWFNPKKMNRISFTRKFPLKPVVSALALLGITTYFLCLGLYVASQDRKG